MKQRTGGTKRSSWLTFRRRLLLVRLLLRGPAGSEDLIAAVQEALGADGYPAAAAAALKHDLDALKGEYNCRIVFQREYSRYYIEDPGELALLDITGDTLEALAFLDASYPAGSAVPEQASMRALIDRVIRLLPARQLSELQVRRANSRSQSTSAATGRIDPTVLLTIRRAIEEKRTIGFRYWSGIDVGAPRRHRVAPYAITFRPEGYGYLDATLIDTTPPGNEPANAVMDYRLDRIVPGTVQVFPQSVPEPRPQPQEFTLRYWLHPNIARRRDVVAYFPSTEINYYDDGSAIVSARITNLWQTRQILLRYGEGCRVLEPPQLVDLFRRTAAGLAELYGAETES